MTFEEAQKAIAKGQTVQWQDRNGDWNDVDPKTCELTIARDIGSKLRVKMEESKMEFDKSKVYTALNADELKPGSKVILADCLNTLKLYVEDNNVTTLASIKDETSMTRFKADDGSSWNLAYLISEPEEKELVWTDLNVGDIIKKTKAPRKIAMVVQIDVDGESMHILAGATWLGDDELEEWEKVGD